MKSKYMTAEIRREIRDARLSLMDIRGILDNAIFKLDQSLDTLNLTPRKIGQICGALEVLRSVCNNPTKQHVDYLINLMRK